MITSTRIFSVAALGRAPVELVEELVEVRQQQLVLHDRVDARRC